MSRSLKHQINLLVITCDEKNFTWHLSQEIFYRADLMIRFIHWAGLMIRFIHQADLMIRFIHQAVLKIRIMHQAGLKIKIFPRAGPPGKFHWASFTGELIQDVSYVTLLLIFLKRQVNLLAIKFKHKNPLEGYIFSIAGTCTYTRSRCLH